MKRTYCITLSNVGGAVLDTKFVEFSVEDDVIDGPAIVCEVAQRMLRDAGQLHPGDTLRVGEI